MRIVSRLPLVTVPVSGRIGHPAHSLTVVAKALFRLEPDRLTQLLDGEDLSYPTGDVPAVEDDDDHSEIRYASDFVHYKPRTDLILVGTCHPPGREAVGSCRVTFQVGDYGRSLQVFGDRWWAGGTVGHSITDPQPFTEMELSWERAYGGPRCPDNPVGRGHEPVELEDGRQAWPLPNIEYPEQLVAAPDDRPTPAGFGPVPITWEPRRSRSGTYDDRWLQTRWPWFPDDLDWGLFNAAAPGLQPEGSLRGDEEIYLENLHPEEPHFRTRLPGIRVRCFVNELPEGVEPPPATEKEREAWSPPPREEMAFREIPVALDTVWVDAEEGLVALVWRGYGPARDEEFSGVQDLFVMAEPLDEPAAELEACRTAFWALVDEEEGSYEEGEGALAAGDDAAASETEGAAKEEGTGHAPEDEELELDLPFDPKAKLREDMERLGIDPDNPPQPTEEELQQAKEFFRERGMDHIVDLLEEAEEEPEADTAEASADPWTRERVAERYAQGRDLAGADLRGLDLSEMELEGIELTGANLTGTNLAGSVLVNARLDKARLVGANLEKADLNGSNLAGGDLTEARMSGANLPGADLTGAVLEGVDLRDADLAQALFEEARLPGADLTRARGAEAVFVHADLTGAILIDGEFPSGEFTDAVLDRVDARGASFESAEFDRVRAVEGMFAGANMKELRAADALDLTGANFSQIEGTDSIWSGATLERAVLAWAVLDGADFTGANLQGADLYAAHLREARFTKANLLDARLAGADAFEAKFDKADLARADLRGGSFYAAEFLDARFWETATEGANLAMTKYG